MSVPTSTYLRSQTPGELGNLAKNTKGAILKFPSNKCWRQSKEKVAGLLCVPPSIGKDGQGTYRTAGLSTNCFPRFNSPASPGEQRKMYPCPTTQASQHWQYWARQTIGLTQQAASCCDCLEAWVISAIAQMEEDIWCFPSLMLLISKSRKLANSACNTAGFYLLHPACTV